MSNQQLYLIELPPGTNQAQITKAKTVEELEKTCSRLTNTVEYDLKKRLLVHREERDRWYAQPKFKRIYKYVHKVQENKASAETKPRKIRTLKKVE